MLRLLYGHGGQEFRLSLYLEISGFQSVGGHSNDEECAMKTRKESGTEMAASGT
jgi:hypothetical protein